MQGKLTAEDHIWRDAYYIAWVGACNPAAVERTLRRYQESHTQGHPALRAIAGHLPYLRGTSLGPELEDLGAVECSARRLGLIGGDR